MAPTHRNVPAFRRSVIAFAALALLALAAVPAAAVAEDLWLHVRVDEEDGARVSVNLPIAFVEAAVRMIPEAGNQGRIVIDDQDFDVADLREMWAALGDTGEAVLVDVDDDGETVQVRKTGGYLLVDVDERGEGARVDVRIPERVVEALLSAEGDELDVAAALRALAENGEGELVTVNDRNARVRVWVDSLSASD